MAEELFQIVALVVPAVVLFLLIYGAVRLALRHERQERDRKD